jgi:uncharacterized protein (TIGR02757 family)
MVLSIFAFMSASQIQRFLDQKTKEHNQPLFIKDDPICIPHLFKERQDIEIAGFFAAIFSWGNRTTIINKSKELMSRMDMEPYRFCLDHRATDLKRVLGFKHRTFNDTDLLYFIEFFKYHYRDHDSLENAFCDHGATVKEMLMGFHRYFFSLEDVPARTKKHVSTPERGSTCKRLNMFLRWMVRRDNNGVDFGIWNNISPSQLICPVDLHVARVARKLKLLTRKQTDWRAAEELTTQLRSFDANDPVKYDFALFAMGVTERY